MSTGAGKVVCVTGASGFTASWLVKLLLDRGYNVKATVRSLRDPRKVEHLMALEGAQERLQLFEANLTEEGSFDSAIDGCEGVFHTATPVFLSVADPQAELIEPAVKGTLNVLRSCRKVPLIRRVVVTSSIATVIYNRNPLKPDVVVNETWFSDPVFCEETKQWYAISKTLAEEVARKFADENDIDLVTLHPGFIIGPLLQPILNLTSEAVVNLIKEGREDWPNRYVDVRDVAHAHILAFENPSASGRYCLVESVTHSSEAPKVINRLYPSLYPSLSLSANTTDNQAATRPYQISKERAKSLGLNFTPLEVSLKDTVENLKENNFLSF